MAEIIPAILTNNEALFLERARQCEQFASYLHIDVADGQFTPSTTVSTQFIAAARLAIPFELHVITNAPYQHLDELLLCRPSRVILHPETTTKLEPLLHTLADRGYETALAFTSRTLRTVQWEQWLQILGLVQQVTFVSIKPGFQGGTLIPFVVQHALWFRQHFPDAMIELDGGINHSTTAIAQHCHAQRYVVGSGVWGQHDPAHAYRDLVTMLQ